MLNPQECTIELKKYFGRLSQLIEEGAILTLMSLKIIDKKKMDDILCCIDASWPGGYTAFVSQSDSDKLKSPQYYLQLLGAIKNRFLFSNTVYSVRHAEALSLIKSIMDSIDTDIRIIYGDQS